MDITSLPIAAVEVLPTERAPRRWRLGQQPTASPKVVAEPEPGAAGPDAAEVEEQEDPSPLASFGRWLADIEDTGPAVVAVLEPEAEAPETSDERVRGLQQEVQDLADELETVRQRAAAERMRLLEDLAAAREARHAAEQELAAVRAVLDVAERQLPRQRGGYVSAS